MQKAIEFKNGHGLKLRGVIHQPKSYDTGIIMLHGFPGDITGDTKFRCEALCKLGYLAMRFNFSCSSTS